MKQSKKMTKYLRLTYAMGISIVLFNIGYLMLSGYHLLSGENIRAFGDSNKFVSVPIQASRGSIYDRYGNVIAYDIETYNIILILDENRPAQENEITFVKDPQETAKQLAPILNMDEADLTNRIVDGKTRGLFQIELGSAGKGLHFDVKDEIDALELPGIEFEVFKERFYPNGSFAAYAVGYAKTSPDNPAIIGEMGVEKTFNSFLTGKNGRRTYMTDSLGYKLPQSEEFVQKAIDGHDVYLTINKDIQFILDTVGKEYMSNGAQDLNAIVMDAKTGEILALTSHPSFDPNIRNITNFVNPLVGLPIEPGSTFKVFTYAAAMDAGVYDPNATFKSGNFNMRQNDGLELVNFYDWDRNGFGEITFDQGFLKSSNVGIGHLLTRYLDQDVYRQYLEDFGFYQLVNTDIEGEVAGESLFTFPSDRITTGFGQASTVTPIQMVQAFSAITNNGQMVKPYLVDRVVDPVSGKVVHQGKTEVTGQPIKPETAQQMLDLLERTVTDESSVGHSYMLDGYSIGGKTGTGEFTRDGKYVANSYYYSFISAVPAQDPEVIIYFGSHAHASEDRQLRIDFFHQVVKAVYTSRGIGREGVSVDKIEYEMPNFKNMSRQHVLSFLDSKQTNYVILGNGDTIINQSVLPHSHINNKERVILLSDGDEVQMPNIIGWSRREVLQLQSLLQFNFDVNGNGFVTSQSIPEGTVISATDIISVTLE